MPAVRGVGLAPPLRILQRLLGYLDNPIVAADPTLRAFAAVPLRTHDGHSIGTLCVFDRLVRTFTRDDLHDLGEFAAIAMRELDLRLASRRAVFTP